MKNWIMTSPWWQFLPICYAILLIVFFFIWYFLVGDPEIPSENNEDES